MILSIIIPIRNEIKYIEKCLDSVLSFDLPPETETEILVIDGMSTDGTLSIIEKYRQNNNNISLYQNQNLIQSSALNIGIRKAKGDYILRLDAHAEYPSNYIKQVYSTFLEQDADNVGGQIITLPGEDKFSAHLVQALTTHFFGVGNAGFRTGAAAGYTDTVPYGFFRRKLFEEIGGFDERLVRGQDYELNSRLRKLGKKIWRNPEINFKYFNQPSLIQFLRKQIKLEAPYNAYMWYLAPYTFAYRHAITGVFTSSVIAGVPLAASFSLFGILFISVAILYSLLAVIASIQQAVRYKKMWYVLILPFCFFLYHFGHGIGVLFGLINLILKRSPVQKIKEPWPGAGKFRILPIETL
jgi:glycosyltransferase involved in cell wall biosynthesis